MKAPKLRVARATNDLKTISEMYRSGLELEVIGDFADHAGFDGVMLGAPGAGYHLEFTHERGHEAPRSASAENLLVFYVPDEMSFRGRESKMLAAGFRKVTSHNPFWDQCGVTFEDPEGYRVVVCRRSWDGN